MITIKFLQRQIAKAKARIEDLEARQDQLSQHGYWELGYFKGRLNVLEDWLDELMEVENGD
jgi:hypothetical protein